MCERERVVDTVNGCGCVHCGCGVVCMRGGRAGGVCRVGVR